MQSNFCFNPILKNQEIFEMPDFIDNYCTGNSFFYPAVSKNHNKPHK
jgi:hypothetical protein